MVARNLTFLIRPFVLWDSFAKGFQYPCRASFQLVIRYVPRFSERYYLAKALEINRTKAQRHFNSSPTFTTPDQEANVNSGARDKPSSTFRVQADKQLGCDHGIYETL